MFNHLGTPLLREFTAHDKGRSPVPNRLFFFNIVQTAFDPPPPLVFEHLRCGLYCGL